MKILKERIDSKYNAFFPLKKFFLFFLRISFIMLIRAPLELK